MRRQLLPHAMRDNSRWLMLLALFESEQPLSVTRLSLVARATMSTTLRHVDELTAGQLASRDVFDFGKIPWVRLTERGQKLVATYLDAL